MTREIETMFAYVMVDPNDNTEGVTAFAGMSGWVPMVGADPERMNQLRPVAEVIAATKGARVELVEFTTRRHVEWIE